MLTATVGRAHLTGAALALCGVLTACTSPGGSGLTREEFCTSDQPAITDVTARAEGRAVVVDWREAFDSRDERTFRVYRRDSPTARWTRVGEVVLAPGTGGTYADASPLPDDTAQYGVTQMGTCGEGPLCSGTGVVRVCSVADVARRST